MKIAVAPFIKWFDQRVAYHAAILEREARLAGDHSLKPAGGRAIVLAEIGWTNDAAQRRISRWRTDGGEGDLALIENALEAAGVPLVELYPATAADAEMFTRFCALCDEEVRTDSTLICPWCESRTNNTTTCPSCGGRKSGPARVCIACVERDEHGHHAKLHAVSDRCACGGRKQRWALSCWSCYVASGGHRGRRHRKSERNLAKIDQATLERAYALYEEGLSLRAVAKVVLPDTGYANANSCANSLHELWQRRGWPLRDRVEAMVASNRERAFRPQCQHVHTIGARKGERCQKRSIGEDGYCWHHKPENIAQGIARLRAV